MTKIDVAADCGNSPKMQFLKDFNVAFAQSDLDFLLQAVSDDIRWEMVGETVVKGKESFAATLKEMEGEHPTAMRIAKVITHGKTGAVQGEFLMRNGKKYAYCDVYGFKSAKGDRISSIQSYVIQLKV